MRRRILLCALLLLLLAELAGLYILSRPAGEAPSPLPRSGAGMTPAPTPTPSPTPEPTPTPSPTPTPDPAERRLASMTLWEKVCQLLVLRPSDLDPASVTEAGPGLAEALAAYPVGGLFYQADNLVTQDQVRRMIADTQAMSGLPLLIACDEEGGSVSRLMRAVGTTWVGPMLDYQDDGPDTAYQNARVIAADMAALGFNLDLAPVADVWSNPTNTVIGRRAYSDDFQRAAELIPAAVEGFHAGGVACTLKHFPGHGDTAQDSHDGAAYVTKTLDALRREELLPFAAGIDAGADAVMIGHLIVPDAGGEPALLSYAIVTELLRNELGFDGVVMTDALEMGAVAGRYAPGELAVRAVQAGVDLLLCPTDVEETAAALMEAAADGTISQARLDESVLRILHMKLDRGLL